MNVLVVGGAGYIGSHCVRQLIASGHRPVVLDNLVFGHRPAVASTVPFHDVNLGDETAVGKILVDEKIDVVMHFAAFAYVGESVHDPLKYYFNNVVGTLQLLRTMLAKNVKMFVFSSTCATYGIPTKMPIVESMPQGVCMFGPDWRVFAYNRRYVDLMGYPEDLIAIGTSLETTLRFRVARGDYGPGEPDTLVANRIAEFGDERRAIIFAVISESRRKILFWICGS